MYAACFGVVRIRGVKSWFKNAGGSAGNTRKSPCTASSMRSTSPVPTTASKKLRLYAILYCSTRAYGAGRSVGRVRVSLSESDKLEVNGCLRPRSTIILAREHEASEFWNQF